MRDEAAIPAPGLPYSSANQESASMQPARDGASAAGGVPSIFVRLLRLDEHKVAGEILGLAFADKYGPVLGHDPELAAEVAAILPTGGQIYLALLDGAPAGTATLRRRGDPAFGWEETNQMWQAIRRKRGFFGAVRAFFLMSIMEGGGPLDAYTGYVAAVGVLPQFQGLGVGTAMLARIELDARAMSLRRITLHVVDSNSGARRLYERNGYHIEKTSVRPFLRTTWNFSGSHYMVKDL